MTSTTSMSEAPRQPRTIALLVAGSMFMEQLDGTVIASGRGLNTNIIQPAAGLSGAGAITLTKAVKGDKVVVVLNTTASPFTDVSSSFESTISVTGQIQETVSVSGNNILVFLSAQS